MTTSDSTTKSAEDFTSEEILIALFCKVDDQCQSVKELREKHPQAKLHPSELITIGMFFALKGLGPRAFYHRFKCDFGHLFPHLPERTRLFRLLAAHKLWAERFLAQPTVFGVCDSFGIELIHPIREKRSPNQLGKKGKSNHRWIVGVKLMVILNKWGLVVDWDWHTANTHDTVFQPIIKIYQDQMIVLADSGFHAKEGDPTNLKLCARGQWNQRMLVETFNSLLSHVCHIKKMSQRVSKYMEARLAFTIALFNTLVQWDGLQFDEETGFLRTSIAHFML